jgi:outer membrane protein
MQEIILSVPEGKAARAALEKEVKEKDAYFIKEKKELERQDAELLKQRSLLSEEARTEKQMEFQKKVLAHRREEEEFQQKLKQKEIEATQKIASKAAKIVESLALKHHLAEVREASQSGLVYIRNHLDLTKEVIAAYDAQPEAKKDAAKPAAKP